MFAHVPSVIRYRNSLTTIRTFAKEIKFGIEGKNLLLKGAETVADVVSVTIGPKGGSVIVGARKPKISKDGQFLANSVTLTNEYENVGAQILQKMAEATHKEVNNCTKSATILAREIAKNGYKKIIKGSNPVDIRKGIMAGVEVAWNYLDKLSRKVKSKQEIEYIATIFAGGDKEMGRTIADAITLVGKDGVITVKETEDPIERANISRGLILESGLSLCNFPVEKDARIKLENALLLIYNKKVDHFKTLVPLLEVAVSRHKPLVIVAEEFSPKIALTFALNTENVIGVKFVTVKIPNDKDFDKDILKDLAFASGGKIYGNESCGNTNKIDESYFGEVPEICLTKKEMICVHGNNQLVMDKVNELKSLITKTGNPTEKKTLEDRLHRLEANFAIITINGTDEELAKKKKEKIYTIIENTKTAMEDGIVPGGGMALFRCADKINKMEKLSTDFKLGADLLAQSLNAPFKAIIKNSHENPAPILLHLNELSETMGYDVNRGDYVDMFQTGIVEPTKAIKSALKNAAISASLMITAEAVVVYKFDGSEIVLG